MLTDGASTIFHKLRAKDGVAGTQVIDVSFLALIRVSFTSSSTVWNGTPEDSIRMAGKRYELNSIVVEDVVEEKMSD